MAGSAGARVFIVDDHPLIRLGLRHLIEPEDGLSVAGEAASAEEALAEIAGNPPDVALVDRSLPEMSGIKCVRRLTDAHANLKILVLSTRGTKGTVRKALDAGAHGYLLKANADDLLGTALREVLAGRRYLCPSIQERFDR